MPTRSSPPIKLQGRDGLVYFAAPELVAAAETAADLGRPLLLTGEPGCGKTEFAWAVAHHLGAQRGVAGVEDCYVRSDSRARDLLYRYDSLRRFADAQSSQYDESARKLVQDPENYIEYEGLGRALMATDDRVRVVLIDEIDKAPRDFPNDLLRELNRGGFTVTETGKSYKPEREPFVLITSNVERQLPDPFLRRCIFFHIRFPGEETLKQIVDLHLDRLRQRDSAVAPPDPEYRDAIVKTFHRLRREEGERKLEKQPATSELIDWVTVLFQRGRYSARREAVLAVHRQIATNEAADYSTLPALHCLVKLAGDLVRVGQGA